MDPLIIAAVTCSVIALTLALAADISFARAKPPISARDGHATQ